jgi:hypothetical protein
MPNPVKSYSNYVIDDITGSFQEQQQYIAPESSGSAPILFTIDGPLSLKGTNLPYTVTASKRK